jgi:hypothetical protein
MHLELEPFLSIPDTVPQTSRLPNRLFQTEGSAGPLQVLFLWPLCDSQFLRWEIGGVGGTG